MEKTNETMDSQIENVNTVNDVANDAELAQDYLDDKIKEDDSFADYVDEGIKADGSLTDYLYNETPAFVKLSDKYEDVLSSAYTMIFVGVAGIIVWFLLFFNIIPMGLDPASSWLMYSVMGGMFIIFVVAGVVSFMHAKQIKIHAQEQDKLIEEIKAWAIENITKKDIEVEENDMPQELVYMEKTNKIKEIIMHQFENADEALAYELKDDIYEAIEKK